jgi:hypothetical protein
MINYAGILGAINWHYHVGDENMRSRGILALEYYYYGWRKACGLRASMTAHFSTLRLDQSQFLRFVRMGAKLIKIVCLRGYSGSDLVYLYYIMAR